MKKSKKKIDFRRFKQFLPYILISVTTLAIAGLGSIDKKNAEFNLNLDAFAAKDYQISVDQLSELYVVADLSDALGMASAADVASNYVVATTMYDASQSLSGKLEKPNLTNISASRGVIEYTVSEGENADTIAAKFGISADQVRWSNGLKTVNVGAGTVLYLPSTGGIVYTVKSGDTTESIAGKYGSNVAEIIALNDLEVSGLSEGMKIVIKGGSLPEKERPEYVAPVVRPTYTSSYASNYTYLGNNSSRQNLRVVYEEFDPRFTGYPNPNPGVPGNCTWYAWYWRATSPLSLGALNHNGRNARTWASDYAYRGVGRTPVVGAVFQTASGGGGYGHVGVVIAVNGDGSIVVREMNYAGRYVVTESTITDPGSFNYIY